MNDLSSLEQDTTELMAYANAGDKRAQQAIRYMLGKAVGGEQDVGQLLQKSIANVRGNNVQFSDRNPEGVIESLQDKAIQMGRYPAPEGYVPAEERQSQPTEREAKLLEIIMRLSDELEQVKGGAPEPEMTEDAPQL